MIALVYPWMECNIRQYLTSALSSLDRFATVCGAGNLPEMSLLSRTPLQLRDIAGALTYLHSKDIIHGDMRGVSSSLYPHSARWNMFSSHCRQTSSLIRKVASRSPTSGSRDTPTPAPHA